MAEAAVQAVEGDEGLRRRALQALGPLGPELAREALEWGVVEVQRDVLEWTGSTGPVQAHRVILWVEPDLYAEVTAAPSATDALTAAIAASIAKVPGNALAELELRPRAGVHPSTSPYRGRS